VVLDRGRVVEEGTHDVLMAQQGAYYSLYQAQARNIDMDTGRSDNAEKAGVA
jgi:ATP-binding cassette subfamily B protein